MWVHGIPSFIDLGAKTAAAASLLARAIGLPEHWVIAKNTDLDLPKKP